MNQLELLRFAIDAVEQIGIRYMVVGSFGSGAYGEPRLTQDIDIVIDPTEPQLRILCASFPEHDFYVSLAAALQAQHAPDGQFNVIHPESGNKIDFMFARKDQWGREEISRRQKVRLLPDREAFAARPEDVMISKMLYYQEGGSEKHLRDIAGMMKLSGDQVDRAYMTRWTTALGITDIWEAILKRLNPL